MMINTMSLAAVNVYSVLNGENEALEKLFLNVLDRGITASYLIIAVLIVRFLLRNAPKNFRFMLWILAGIRLICPYSIESALSLVPVHHPLNSSVMYMQNIQTDTGIPALSESAGQELPGQEISVAGSANRPIDFVIYVCARIWIAGVIILGGYLLCSWLSLKRKLRTSVPKEMIVNGNCVKIYNSSQIESPFLFGLIRPKIYVPYSVSDKDICYVIAHESMHKKRRDYLLKPAGFLVLACYWFHPLVWVSYMLMCRDMEFACDEAVIRTLGLEHRKEYSKALLSCSVSERHIAACPTAFGESGVKERIRSILSYKKPAVWVITAAAVLCAAVAVCFMTQKKEETTPIPEAEGAASISSYFPDSHEEQNYLTLEADLDKDGNPEKIVMSDLGYNGGDGGYKIEVFRVKNGTEQKIPLPDGYEEEAGFPFQMEWAGKEAGLSTPKGEKILFSEEQILEIYKNHGTEEQIKSFMEEGFSLEYPSDAVSGFTVTEDAKDHRPVLVLKQYLMGYLGHADCFGYAVSFLKLQEDNTWDAEYLYLQD